VKPIIFNTEMVRAILNGRKTQTRRVIKPQPDADGFIKSASTEHPQEWKFTKKVFNGVCNAKTDWIKCPYRQPGDVLWVRETHAFIWPGEDPVPLEECNIEYKADTGSAYPGRWPAEEARGNPEAPKWCPSIHMPRWAARLFLKITDVRVERVQDISLADVLAEGTEIGAIPWEDCRGNVYPEQDEYATLENFIVLWDSINSKRGYPWESNPWCWVIEFEVTNCDNKEE